MKQSSQVSGVPSLARVYTVAVQNVGAEDAPPYAVMQVAGLSPTEGGYLRAVAKPTGAATAAYVFNTPETLASYAFGSAAEGAGLVAVSGTPAVNQEIGPVGNSWAMSTSGKGYLYLGSFDTGVGLVVRTLGGTNYPIVRILNTSGFTLPAGSICGLGTPYTFPPAVLDSVYTWYDVAPTKGKAFCIVLGGIANNTIGDAAPVGVVACQVYLSTATHEYADVANGTRTWLNSAASGSARILWREKGLIAGAGTLGPQWAIVMLNAGAAAVTDVRGWTTSQVTAATGSRNGTTTPGTGTAKLGIMPTSGAAGTPWQADSTNVNVENWMRGTIAIYKPVLLDFSRYADDGSKIYTVKSEGCIEIPSG